MIDVLGQSWVIFIARKMARDRFMMSTGRFANYKHADSKMAAFLLWSGFVFIALTLEFDDICLFLVWHRFQMKM